MSRFLWFFIGVNGALFVGLSAYASHASIFSEQPYLLTIFEKAHYHHGFHLVALLVVAVTLIVKVSRWLLVCASFFIFGILFFSFTLYLFSLSGVKIAGFLTPIGGVCFILGWLCLCGFGLSKALGTKSATERINE